MNDTSTSCNADVLTTHYENTIQELVEFPTHLKAFLVDNDGNFIENPGTESTAEGLCSVVDPWEMSVSLSGGPPGATLSGTTNVQFVGGIADFSDLMIDTAGSGYSLTLSISHSSQGNVVSDLSLPLPDAGIRPLAFKITSNPSLEKQAETFSTPFVASLWDVVNDVRADTTLVAAVNCEISLLTQGATLSGTMLVTMDASKFYLKLEKYNRK